MKKKWMNRKFILLIALFAILMVSIPGTISFMVLKVGPLVNIFTFGEDSLGDVVICNEVEHPYGSAYSIPQSITFDYEVNLGIAYAGDAVETSEGTFIADENGVIKITVIPGKPFGLKNIEENTDVTVTEVGQRSGFFLKGDAVQIVTVSKNMSVQVDYINVYEPEKSELVSFLDASISKNIAGRSWQDGDTFEFVIDRFDAKNGSWCKLGTASIVGTSEQKIVSIHKLLEDEVFGMIGTYYYRITEREGSDKDMTYDTEPRYLTVVVADEEMDGTLDIHEIRVSRGAAIAFDEERNSYTVNITFHNIYEKPHLNTADHYGYILGYPVDYRTGELTDDKSLWPIRPEGDITRAEVATIFFRMITEISRAQYQSQICRFSDVAPSDWYYNAVSTLANAGILNGYPDGTFDPDGKISRAELAAIALRFHHGDSVFDGKDHFPDIAGHWAQNIINAAAEQGVINGYPDGTFSPDQSITRAEAVAMVNRTLGRKPHKDHLHGDMLVWPDNMDVSAWYYADMQEATNSHTYEIHGEGNDSYEIWTAILPARN